MNHKLVFLKDAGNVLFFFIQLSYSHKCCRKLRDKLRSNTAYFILGCGFKGALLRLGAHLYSPGRASAEQTYIRQQMLRHSGTKPENKPHVCCHH